MRRVPLAAIALLLLSGCTTDAEPASAPSLQPTTSPRSPSETVSSPPPSARPSTPEPSAEVTPPARFDTDAAMADVRALAGRIGPRLATSPAYRRSALLVAQRFTELGYNVSTPSFPVPAGDSWGVPVDAGRSSNVVATPKGFDRTEPHLVIGAHLDTVAVAPGAEDNASGVSVVLELARLAGLEGTRLPTVFIAFGAEEPVGSGDDLHHFGSRHYVRQMGRAQRQSLQAMVSLDRVGVGRTVPVCTGPLSPASVQNRLLSLADRERIRVQRCEEANTTSDHWSFEKAGIPVARLGSTPYAGYHNAADLPRVVNQQQLSRTGRLAWAWIS